MKHSIFLFILCVSVTVGVSKESSGAGAIALDAAFEVATEPMTTEDVWNLDPDEPNPHRRRWVLERRIETSGWETFQKKKGFGVRLKGILSRNRLHLRGEGPWYATFKDFPCSRTSPTDLFMTREGAARMGKEAARLWEKQLEGNLEVLNAALKRVSGPKEGDVRLEGRRVMLVWLERQQREWRQAVEARIARDQWERDRREAQKAKICSEGGRNRGGALKPWAEMMEPLPEKATTQPLARAPARRWNGRFTIRVGVDVGGETLLGQFLIDTSSERSLISRTWLESQGMTLPFLLASTRYGTPMEVSWAGGTDTGIPIRVSVVEISGYPVNFDEFWVTETKAFAPPQHVAFCCDGVLGRDFLRRFVVELNPHHPVHVNLWSRQSFRWSTDSVWVEASDQGGLNWVSDECSLRGGRNRIRGVRWSTAEGLELALHLPWHGEAGRGGRHLQCGTSAGKSLDLTPKIRAGKTMRHDSRMPGLTTGVELLSRGAVVVDLPHGRLWLEREALGRSTLVNRSGLQLEYEFGKQLNRKLRVVSIRDGTPAAYLKRHGLRPGMLVTRINSRPVEDLDLWEVERILAGGDGTGVVLEWATRGGVRIVPFTVKR